MQGIIAPFALTFRLWRRFWPQLVALVLIGRLAHTALLQLAVHTGFANHLAGLAVLTLVALAQLVVTVTMFQVLLPGLPAIRAAQDAARGDAPPDANATRWLSAITVSLLPFFAYYAAWGFLGNTVRQYSRLALDLDPLGEHGMILDALDSRWLLVSVAISWTLRKLALRLQQSTGRPLWQIVVVVCETNWILIGLYVISRWKDQLWNWIAHSTVWDQLLSLLNAALTPMAAAWAATAHAGPPIPVESLADSPGELLTSLFFYALFPLVWLVMTALVYGYDVRNDEALLRANRRVERVGERYRAIPKFLRDFIAHFIGGYRSRYLPVANSVRLTLNSGVLLLITLIIGYRVITWGKDWLWIGGVRLMGPHDLETAQLIAEGLVLLLGSPIGDSSTGLLIEPLRICFLVAILETAFSQPGTRRATAATSSASTAAAARSADNAAAAPSASPSP